MDSLVLTWSRANSVRTSCIDGKGYVIKVVKGIKSDPSLGLKASLAISMNTPYWIGNRAKMNSGNWR